MRKLLVVLAAMGASACSRGFTPPRTQGTEQLVAVPSVRTLAPNQIVPLQFHGGVPPYSVRSAIDAGPDCGPRDDDGGAQGQYAACLRPGLQDQLAVEDSANHAVSVSMTVGPAMQALVPQGPERECSEIQLTITGGAPDYAVVQLDGGVATACDGGAAPLRLTHLTNISRYSLTVPAYQPGTSNAYALRIVDAVENAKVLQGGAPDPGNVIDFPLQVSATPQALVPISVVSPVQVTPGTSVNLTYAPHDRQVSFRLAPQGNSSGCTLSAAGLYTAGSNANTVDHVLLDDTALGTTTEIWIQVGDPVVVLPVIATGLLLAGDLNGDGLTDLLLASDRGATGALQMVVVPGSVAGPSAGATLYLPLPQRDQVSNLELADVNADGLADVVVSFSGNGGGSGPVDSGPPPNCYPNQPSQCTQAGAVDRSNFDISCGSLADGGWSCGGASIYDAAGNPRGQVAATFTGPDAVDFSSGGSTIACTYGDAGYGPNFHCNAGCVPLSGGGTLCDQAWRCGDGGCEPRAAGVDCYPNPPGVISCNVEVVQTDGGQHQATCTPNPDGTLSCGPVTCRYDGRGGWSCGPNNCVGDGTGAYYCVQGVCGFPPAGPEAQCNQNGPNTPATCHACVNWNPNPGGGGNGGNGDPGGVEVYLSQPGGSFADVGAIPGAPSALPGLFQGSQLLLGSGEIIETARVGGGVAFVDAGMLSIPPAGGGHGAQVVVAHDKIGAPWGAYLASEVFGTGGSSGMDEVDGFGDIDGGVAHVPIGPQASRNLAPLHAAPLREEDSAESIVIWDPPGPSSSKDTLWVQAPPDQHCELTPVVFSSLRPANEPPWTDPVSAVVALPELKGLAVATQAAGGTNLGGQWHLLTGELHGCGLVAVSWTSRGLPDLTRDRLITGIASGDFNGDGIADLAVATPGRIETFLGSVTGNFGAGDQYATAGPLASLTASHPAPGRGLVAGMELLDRRVQVFSTASNHPPDGGSTSHLAYVAAWSVPDLAGVILRGPELWAAQANAGVVSITRYLDATDPNAPHFVTVLQNINNPLAPADFAAIFQPDTTRDDAAWMILTDPGSHDLVPIALQAEPDGGLQVTALPSLSHDGGVYTGALGAPDGGLELMLFDQRTTTIYAGGSGQAQTSFGSAQQGIFVPACQADNPAVFVVGTPLVILSGFAQCPPGPGANGCCASGGPSEFIYNLADGSLVPVRAPDSARIRSAYAATLVDGGSGAVLVAGVGRPGVFALVSDPDAGAWIVDKTLSVGASALELGLFPGEDGGPARHVASQLTPGALQIVGR
jgi:hypothetical protein